MKLSYYLILFVTLNSLFSCKAQDCYWQQHADYTMEIDMDVKKNQFTGKQTIVYTNNSPDELNKVFYHLYYNAFQPNSMMDVRSRTIEDPDSRVGDRIYHLEESEIGYHKIKSLKQNGKELNFKVVGTILEVELNTPIKSGKKATFDMEFESQVPLQIRRTGRDNKEGVRYSMTQWYPKMCEYDRDGWHSNPYIGREFHGVWGEFDVKINIDKSYVLGGTGYIQNPNEVGCGYETGSVKETTGDKKTWHFNAPKVHDFAWAADPDFVHDKVSLDNGTVLHFIYQKDSLQQNWKDLAPMAKDGFEYINENFGEYPYEQYSVIQGGDGGMEYPMCTLITSRGSFNGLVSVTIHEALHSWFQGLLATNESKYPWMDEGFTTFAQSKTLNHLYGNNAMNPLTRNYQGYIRLANTDKQEPLTTHADFYKRNGVYGSNAYSKGAVFMMQLGYIIGDENMMKGMKEYYYTWRFKHPTPQDLKKIMEEVSGLELDWYFEQFIGTINTIDYSISEVKKNGNGTKVIINRIDDMPMPLDVVVKLKNEELKYYNIPLRIMRGYKTDTNFYTLEMNKREPWPWVYPSYALELKDVNLEDIESIIIDPTYRLADIDPTNNLWSAEDNAEMNNEPIIFGE